MSALIRDWFLVHAFPLGNWVLHRSVLLVYWPAAVPLRWQSASPCYKK